MKPIEKWRALLAVADAKTSDDPDPLALALIEAERVNVDLFRENQRLRIALYEAEDTLKNYVEMMEVYLVETKV